MRDRDFILSQLSANKPDETPLPAINLPRSVSANLLDQFTHIAKEVGAQVIETSRNEIDATLLSIHPELNPVKADEVLAEDELPALGLFVCEGELGVAENGAIWVPDRALKQRITPFITQHIAIILDKTKIVVDMHAAYAQIDVAEDGFGVFISGPSKTADIEQSLVQGAHGPRSLVVLLVN